MIKASNLIQAAGSPLLAASHRKKKRSRNAKSAVTYLVLIVLGIALIFPFFFMLMKSFMTFEEAIEKPTRFFPGGIHYQNYIQLLSDKDYILYFFNTIKIVAFNIIAVPLSCSLCGYAFSKLKWAGRNPVFACVLATMMIPVFVVQVPQYVMFSDLGMIGTSWPLMLPNLFGGGAINIFLMRQYMRSLNSSIDEAAKIDGASAMRRFLFVTIPLCIPILIFIIVNTFIANWSDYYGPLVYLMNSERKYTLAVGIYTKMIYAGAGNADSQLRCAMGIMMSIPPSILFFIFQKQLIEGVAVGAVKG